MDYFYWALIGVLVAFVAKVQLPVDGEENIFALLVLGVVGAIGAGAMVHLFGRGGFLGLSWVSHIAAFIGAVALVLAMRVMTKQHLA